MKIAIFSGEIPTSTFIEKLITGVSQKHDVYLFGVKNRRYNIPNDNVHIIETPKNKWRNLLVSGVRIILLLFKSTKDLSKLIKEIKKFPTAFDKWIWFTKFLPIVLYKPEILHLQWARDVEFYTFLQDFGIKIIVSLRGAHINYTPVVDERAKKEYLKNFPKMDGFHAVSETIKTLATKYGSDITKTKVIHSPISLDLLQQYEPSVRAKDSIFKILAVGRFHWIKGMRYTFDALKLLKERNLKFKFSFVSTNAIPEEILFQIVQLGLEDNVKLFSEIEQNSLYDMMKRNDVLVLSSLDEGIANVVLEAMALGLAVVSTDCGGMPEVVIPYKTGWLLPTRNPQALAEALMEVHSTSENKLNEIRKNAHELVKENFNAESSIASFIELYETVLKN